MIRKAFFFLLLLLFSFSSKPQNYPVSDYFNDIHWYRDDNPAIENGMMHSAAFYDETKNKLAGDTLYPIIFSDDKLIIKQLAVVSTFEKKNGRMQNIIHDPQIITDTVVWDFRQLDSASFLLIFFDEQNPQVFSTGQYIGLPETFHYKQPEIEINGYAPGDTISKTAYFKDTSFMLRGYFIIIASLTNKKQSAFEVM